LAKPKVNTCNRVLISNVVYELMRLRRFEKKSVAQSVVHTIRVGFLVDEINDSPLEDKDPGLPLNRKKVIGQ
jgi:hypothetical protein